MIERLHGCLLQEMASQGLSVIYQLGDASMREKLLSSLMGTLQGTQSLTADCTARYFMNFLPECPVCTAPEPLADQLPTSACVNCRVRIFGAEESVHHTSGSCLIGYHAKLSVHATFAAAWYITSCQLLNMRPR